MDEFSGRVLAVGVPDDARAAVEKVDAVTAVEEVDVAAVTEWDVTLDRPACVLTGHDSPGLDAATITGAVVEQTRSVPVVVYATTEDDSLAADVVAAGAEGYVPRRRGTGELRSVVADAIESGRDRARLARDRSILDGILEQAPLEISAKDTDARHVRSTKTVGEGTATGQTQSEWGDRDRAVVIEQQDREFLDSRERIVDRLVEYESGDHKLDPHDSGWLSVWRYPWYENGELRGLIGFTQDITGEEQTRRELTEKNELLEQFASVVTHDLRNPLNAAMGSLELLDDPEDSQQVELQSRIERSLDRMEEIIADLVRLTRDSDGGASLSSVELATVARKAWETVQTGTATLRVDADDEHIVADEGQLQQVFENLFRNAVEHGSTTPRSQAPDDAVEHGGADSDREASGDEGLTVTVTLRDDGFTVSDDGVGLPDDVVERLNAREFNQGGLGLNIVQTITDRHDWQLAVGESDSGGAEFRFDSCRIIRHPHLRAAVRERVDLTDQRAIGSAAGGSAHRDGNSWIVEGRGRNFWRDINEWYFVDAPVTGDAELVARVDGFESTRIHAKAGLVVTGRRDEESPHSFVGLTGGKGSEVLWQLEPGAGTQSQMAMDDASPPCWYRIRRIGDVVNVASSTDGQRWQSLGEQVLALDDEAFYGLAVTSHEKDVTATARFEDVSLDRVTWE